MKKGEKVGFKLTMRIIKHRGGRERGGGEERESERERNRDRERRCHI